MAEYIEKTELRKAMYHESFEKDSELQRWDSGCWIRYKLFENVVESIPIADVQPVKHGEWIIRDNPGTGWYRVTCSECGEDVTSTAPCIGFFPSAKVTWDYCPDCGARMDGDSNG